MKTVKSIICFVLVIMILTTTALASGTKVTNISELYSSGDDVDPVRIAKATLYESGKEPESVYYVMVKGLDPLACIKGSERNLENCIKAIFSQDNDYTEFVKELLIERIPCGEKLFFVGRSLGGMVLQQVMADETVKKNYEILHTIAIGSPYIITKGKKEGNLRRIVDRTDIVPYLSIVGLCNPYYGSAAVDMCGIFPLTHVCGYKLGGVWKKYDCLGIKNGDSYIVIDEIIYG